MKSKKDSKFSSFMASFVPIITYMFKRILYMIPVMLIISFVLFLLMDMIPGDPALSFISPEEALNMTKEQLQATLNSIREQLGLVGPFHIRYGKWLLRLVTGDFGYSAVHKKAVTDVLPLYLNNTLQLNLLAYLFAFVLSIFVGIKSAVDRNSLFDKVSTVGSLVGISLPSFFIALLLIFLLVIKVQIFPFGGKVNPVLNYQPGTWEYFLDVIYHMTLPIIVITIMNMAGIVRFVKNSMLEVLKQDYIRTAKSKGLKDKVVIYRHAFRNTLVPLITLIGTSIPGLFTGAIVMENIFAWPGMGKLMNDSYTQRDTAVIMAVTIIIAIVTLISNLLVDISYAFVDPRIKVGDDI